MRYTIYDIQLEENHIINISEEEVKEFVYDIVKNRVEDLSDDLSEKWTPHVQKGAGNLPWEVVEDVIYNWEYRLLDNHGNKIIGYK